MSRSSNQLQIRYILYGTKHFTKITDLFNTVVSFFLILVKPYLIYQAVELGATMNEGVKKVSNRVCFNFSDFIDAYM